MPFLNSEKCIQAMIDAVPIRYRTAEMISFDGLDPSRSFYLSGNPGLGKTHLAYAYRLHHLNEARKRTDGPDYFYRPICVINVATLIHEIRNKSFQQRGDLIEQYQECKRLILDDMGAEYKTDYSENVIYTIVEARYSNQLYTGFTSNHRIDDLPYDTGEATRIVSRIRGIVGENGAHVESDDVRLYNEPQDVR